MRARIAERMAWLGAVSLAAVAASALRAGTDPVPVSRPLVAQHVPELGVADSAVIFRAAERVVSRDPFRLERRPADVRFDPDPPPPARPEAPPPRRVAEPRLLGVTGPPWRAILEGVPGRERAVVARVGSTFGELVVARISADTVIVQAPDTSFVLIVRRAWR